MPHEHGHHISQQFDLDLEEARTLFLSMGGLVEQQVSDAIHALLDTDAKLGQSVQQMDRQVNGFETQIDESLVLDLSGHESSELEVVSDGGTMPTAPMLAWARELLVGSWYMLEYRGRTEPVQLAWHGLRRQLSLFVTPTGRCVLFQQQRLAAFLQAGLLLPAQDEALTVKATRNALAKLDADPSRLMN